jgi:hypothetical protein
MSPFRDILSNPPQPRREKKFQHPAIIEGMKHVFFPRRKTFGHLRPIEDMEPLRDVLTAEAVAWVCLGVCCSITVLIDRSGWAWNTPKVGCPCGVSNFNHICSTRDGTTLSARSPETYDMLRIFDCCSWTQQAKSQLAMIPLRFPVCPRTANQVMMSEVRQ